jgi:hypothetical protein
VSFPESADPQLPGVAMARSERSTTGPRNAKIQAMLLRAICACILMGILVAGLWPFHAPRNEVSWLSPGNGLRFGDYASVVSAGSFKASLSPADASCSLEIWLEPGRLDSSGTILAFYQPESRSIPFSLRQSIGDLELHRRTRGRLDRSEKARIYADGVFSHQSPVFVAISSDVSGTTVYADGALVRRSSNFRLSSSDLTGRLVVGNSPTTTDYWSGQVRQVAIYNRRLSAVEVSEDYANLTKNRPTALAESQGVMARYLFNERNGNVAHNQLDSATDLLIPERFFVLHEQFLETPWREFYPEWSYWRDVGINVVGFIPLGFFFSAYFASAREVKRTVLMTIILGFIVSLMIEVLQAFLPTRKSGMTDLMTNTFGTALGATLFTWIAKHNWFGRAGSRFAL